MTADTAGDAEIRVVLPYHLRTLAKIDGDVTLAVVAPVTLRAFLRFFACAEDISFASLDAPLPEAIARGQEPLLIIGAIAGG
jgi:sulfur-carrier protein